MRVNNSSSSNNNGIEDVIDPCCLMPFIFANIEFLAIPLLGWLLLTTDMTVAVVRQWPKQARAAIAKAKKRLNTPIVTTSTSSSPPLLYPSCYVSIEGQRSADGRLSPYKHGVSVLALNEETERMQVIPLIFVGAREALPKGEWRVKSGEITLKVFPNLVASLSSELQQRQEQQVDRGREETIRAIRNDFTSKLRTIAELHHRDMVR